MFRPKSPTVPAAAGSTTANALATTTTSVNVSGSAAPTGIGQLLKIAGLSPLTATWQDPSSYALNISDYGGVGDGVKLNRLVSVTSGSPTVVAPTGTFAAGDVGKLFSCVYARTTNLREYEAFVSTIAAYVSDTTVTLSTNSPVTKSATYTDVMFGTDNASAIAALKTAVDSSITYNVAQFNYGIYMTSAVIPTFETTHKGMEGVYVGRTGNYFSYYGDYTESYIESSQQAQGTVLAYAGAYSATTYFATMRGSLTRDLVGAFWKNISFDGRGMCERTVEISGLMTCGFDNVNAIQPAYTSTSIAWNMTGGAVGPHDFPTYLTRINCIYGCIFTNCSAYSSFIGHGMVCGNGGTNFSGMTFCTFYGLIAKGGTGKDALRLMTGDDNQFFGTAIPGGNLRFDTTMRGDGGFCCTNTFYGLYSPTNVIANGANVQSNSIKGLSGTDSTPTITTTNSAMKVFIEYLGNEAGGLNGLDAFQVVPPLKPAFNHMVKLVTGDAAYSTGALGAYFGKIAITVDGVTKYIPVYS